MADCFSLPNAAEMVNALREEADAVQAVEWEIPICTSNHIAMAADVIEQLLAENAKLKAAFDRCYESNENLYNELQEVKAERDAAVADVKSIALCQKCKHFSINQMTCDALEQCLYGETSLWEWCGVTDTNSGSKKEEQ